MILLAQCAWVRSIIYMARALPRFSKEPLEGTQQGTPGAVWETRERQSGFSLHFGRLGQAPSCCGCHLGDIAHSWAVPDSQLSQARGAGACLQILPLRNTAFLSLSEDLLAPVRRIAGSSCLFLVAALFPALSASPQSLEVFVGTVCVSLSVSLPVLPPTAWKLHQYCLSLAPSHPNIYPAHRTSNLDTNLSAQECFRLNTPQSLPLRAQDTIHPTVEQYNRSCLSEHPTNTSGKLFIMSEYRSRRAPLGEATERVNNAPLQPQGALKVQSTGQKYAPASPSYSDQPHLPLPKGAHSPSSPGTPVNPRLSTISKEYHADSNRHSAISTTSTGSDGKRLKSYIGPWKLGKTLGKGATARVRLARHAYTGQEAAIKIVQKKNAQISQAGSLAALDRAEASMPDSSDGLRRMPVGIEREVAIMKLIQHPNIMKLYDIWENRTEIYLVLEYVDNGELFEHITASGRLDERTAMRYFRQILSAVGYCHSFNICHRDLKPENILLTKADEIKIADFGMAALHQSPDHKLKTSCGSPHYAAPELIKGSTYRGDLTDIWSLGVILYATLAGRLPFDVEGNTPDWLPPLLQKIRKGQYEMAPEFSPEARSLINRMLQVNPKDRITLTQIWKHPLLTKYDYLDDLGHGNHPQSPSTKDCGRPVLRRSDIDKELLRHLRSMWHKLTEQQLLDALLSEEPNEQKLFYSLLVRYRDAQLENYTPDLEYSSSDYHHVRPKGLTKTYSTCHFLQGNAGGHGRQTSRFTVISNTAETELSYDPFRASRPQNMDTLYKDRAIVTIHRNRAESKAKAGNSSPSVRKSGIGSRHMSATSSRSAPGSRGKQHLMPPKGYTSRSSLASSTKSRNSAVVRAKVGHRRGVSFNHARKDSGETQKMSLIVAESTLQELYNNYFEGRDGNGNHEGAVSETPPSTRYIRSKKTQPSGPPALPAPKPGRASALFGEDVRQLSSSLAKDCDEAFNRTLTPQGVAQLKANRISMERPLPSNPPPSDSMKLELLEARKQAEFRKQYDDEESPGYLDRMLTHLDHLIQPISPLRPQNDRRAISAPADSRHLTMGRPLPSIYETVGEETPRGMDRQPQRGQQRRGDLKAGRIASAPEPQGDWSRMGDRYKKDTIRVVNPSIIGSPVRAPEPLTIRKKSYQNDQSQMMSGGLEAEKNKPVKHRGSGLEPRQSDQVGPRGNDSYLDRIDEDDDQYRHNSSSGTVKRMKSAWFKRNSKTSEDDRMSGTGFSQTSSSSTVAPPYDRPGNPHLRNSEVPQPAKKKGFSFGKLFKKRNSKPDMSLDEQSVYDNEASVQGAVVEGNGRGYSARQVEDPRLRQIAPQQNWLAKLFNVKPACIYVCFAVSKTKARKEISDLLKEWKRYGIKDVQVDKERCIVFGKVAPKNYLEIKEVAFAAQIMTVIEHGRKSQLSIARFTQERGAASSFQTVVETLHEVMRCRGVLVADKAKTKMMIKTTSAGMPL